MPPNRLHLAVVDHQKPTHGPADICAWWLEVVFAASTMTIGRVRFHKKQGVGANNWHPTLGRKPAPHHNNAGLVPAHAPVFCETGSKSAELVQADPPNTFRHQPIR